MWKYCWVCFEKRLYCFIANGFFLNEKFCKYFKILRQSYNLVVVSECGFYIETYKIIVSLFYDEIIDIEKEKGFLDQFARKCKICKRGWQSTGQITLYQLEYNYSNVLLDQDYRYVTSFEFKWRPIDETVLHNEVTIDWQNENNQS